MTWTMCLTAVRLLILQISKLTEEKRGLADRIEELEKQLRKREDENLRLRRENDALRDEVRVSMHLSASLCLTACMQCACSGCRFQTLGSGRQSVVSFASGGMQGGGHKQENGRKLQRSASLQRVASSEQTPKKACHSRAARGDAALKTEIEAA